MNFILIFYYLSPKLLYFSVFSTFLVSILYISWYILFMKNLQEHSVHFTYN
jgi:hypothetical protein